MRGAVLVLVLFLGVGCCFGGTLFEHTVPVSTFIWSGQTTFAQPSQVEQQTVAEEDLLRFVRGLEEPLLRSTTGHLERHLSSGALERPEVIAIFVEPVGKWAHEAYTFLRPVLDSSASALIVPYARPSGSLIRRLADVPSVLLSGARGGEEHRAHYVPKSDLVTYLQSNKAIFANGKTEVIVVALTDRDGAFVGVMDGVLKELSNGRYLSIFTAEREYVPDEHINIRPGADERDIVRLVKRSDSDDYWPRSIYEGLLAVIVMGIILIVGIGCLMELQTPTKWEKTKRNIREVN